MAEVHLPQLDESEEGDGPSRRLRRRGRTAAPNATHRPRGRSLLKIALEVVLISTGVFLGLAGEQWRESARHRELAEASLRRFRSEILTNRKAVADVKDYHVTTRKSLEAYFAADPKTRQILSVQIHGIQPVIFEHAAWDLALTTQSLAYIDPQLAFDLSRVYTHQQELAGLSAGIMQAMYLRPPTENLEAFLRALALYYGDAVLEEPALLNMYDDVLPQINQALSESPGKKAASK